MQPEMANWAAAVDLDRRVKLATNPATPARLLASLARDGAVTVRAAVALNASAPEPAHNRLAADPDERVRLLLARKLANALPSLSAPDEAELRDRTIAILATLVQDEAVRVRAIIADCVAAMSDAPHELVLALAQDGAVPVSGPILRLSPLLSPDDLLALLALPPHSGAAIAIACRANLPESVADAIAMTTNNPAICALLANQSAAIREGTLDALIARAASQPEWHAPLVRRPRLPEHAARALAEIVGTHLLGELAGRVDLPADVAASIRARLTDWKARPALDPTSEADQTMVAEARRLEARGELTEIQVLTALRIGANRRATAMLATAATVPVAIVDHAASLRSAKALVSLVWKAGFTMQTAVAVQTTLGQIGPGAVLRPASAQGFPLDEAEMAWQLDFLSGSCR